jgi:hypothetical protein
MHTQFQPGVIFCFDVLAYLIFREQENFHSFWVDRKMNSDRTSSF